MRSPERGAVDPDGVALMAPPREQRIDERLVAQEVVLFVVVEVGRDDGGSAPAALFHQLEEDVGLLRLEVQVAHFIDDQDVDASEPVDELSARAVRERGVHLVEEILGTDKDADDRSAAP